MILLLDTHVFIWWFNEPEKLLKKVLAACEDNKNELTLSVASIWEMQIKRPNFQRIPGSIAVVEEYETPSRARKRYVENF